ncbi:biotin carboxyl carrier protein of acetyl-CoA carboxylase [Macadamia integrifolia]|uniref:biotin carboxyl carrier protein of acetyl-CoA carboxylase n=1 Tax=Macadamia integrifolia TaxID=60698 RepID=UPI001C4FFDEB|nr:biotin carboxyl carrier protein of acetyl-CoA carboxylase [Macadamia integrifolia]
MESAAALRSCYGSLGNFTHVQSLLDRTGGLPFCSTSSNKSSFSQGWTFDGRLISSVNRKATHVPYVTASGSTILATSDVVSSNGTSHGSSQKNVLQGATFPNGFEALVLEVCDKTDVAELKLKVGDFEMHLKRNIEATNTPLPVTSLSAPPPIPSEPMVESAPVASPTSPPKSSTEIASPFKYVSSEKSSKLAALEASGSNAYVLVTSPRVGTFRRGRTLKGKKQPPICKEGDVIKEGQTIGFLDQFGSELPVKSDVAGEVLKLLYREGEAVGYGDPLVAVLPSFHDINIM